MVAKSKEMQLGFFKGQIRKLSEKLFNEVGIKIDGDRPEDIRIKNDKFYIYMLLYISGLNRKSLGEMYMNDMFDVDDLPAFIEKSVNLKIVFNKFLLGVSNLVEASPFDLFSSYSISSSKKDVRNHYDRGNSLFKAMLDKTMNYSCAYWQKHQPIQLLKDAQINNSLCTSLHEAQLNKMYLIARKLDLKPGMTVLDIGCGWGSFTKFLALNFDVNVLGITISKEQYEYAIKDDLDLENLRLPGLKPLGIGKAEFKLIDYRDVKDTFDRVVVIEMIEHVGKKNYDKFFKIAKNCLKEDGLFFLHVIGIDTTYVPQYDPYIHKYIFPNFVIPLHSDLMKSINGRFVIEDFHNIGYDFYRTLNAWHENFNENFHTIEHEYDEKHREKFRRMWSFYLHFCAGLFKARKLNLWHIVMSHDGYKGGYVSAR